MGGWDLGDKGDIPDWSAGAIGGTLSSSLRGKVLYSLLGHAWRQVAGWRGQEQSSLPILSAGERIPFFVKQKLK